MRLKRLVWRNLTVSEWDGARRTLSKMGSILSFVRECWGRQALITAAAFILVPIGLINPYLTQLAVDGPLLNRSVGQLIRYGFLMGAVSLATLLVHHWVTYLQNRFATELRETITQKMYRRLTSFSLDFFRSTNRERNHNILGGDGVDVVVWSLSFVSQTTIVILTYVSRVAMVFWIDWRMGCLVLAAVPFYLLKANILARKNRIVGRVEREAGLAYGKELRDSLGTVDVMKTYRTEDYHTQRVFGALRRATEIRKKDHRFELFFGSLSSFAIKALDGIPVLVGALLVASGHLTLGQLSAALLYVNQAVVAQSEFIELIPQLAGRSVAVNAFTDFMKKKPTVTEAPDAVDVDFRGADIRIEDVSFAYLPNLPVLEGVTCRIRSGRWTGIQAPSGYGKTTLLNLILRLYDVQSGRILIGERDVRGITFQSFASQTGIVLQQMFFTRDTIRHVIAYDREEATLAEVREAARLAGIDDFVMTLPRGYETSCGDAASRLSHGQRQRLLIARALLRKPKLLIMDEAFGSVDEATEDRIVSEMKSHFPEMTVLVVSHHSSVLRRMDEVIDLTRVSRRTERPVYRINYVDLGMHAGQEISILLEQLKDHPNVGEIHVYGIDANPYHYRQALKKFVDRDNVRFSFYSFAVGSGEGMTRLYLHPNDLGHSIYADKSGVSRDSIFVQQMRFSQWMKVLPEKDDRTIDILKANIEGAEWDLVRDLEENGLLGRFDLYLGSRPGRFSDVWKVRSLVDAGDAARCEEILSRRGIRVLRLGSPDPACPNADLAAEIRRISAERMKEKRDARLVPVP